MISADAALSLWHRQKEHMKTAGDVTHADVMTREDGKSKGCGLVTYRSEEDAATRSRSSTRPSCATG